MCVCVSSQGAASPDTPHSGVVGQSASSYAASSSAQAVAEACARAGLLPQLSAIATAAAAHTGLPGGPLPPQLSAALASVMSAAAALDGGVAAYSPEAEALAKGIL